jgi:hypothetical protein
MTVRPATCSDNSIQDERQEDAMTQLQRAKPDAVRLVTMFDAPAFATCPTCSSPVRGADRFTIEVNGVQPCSECLPHLVGDQVATTVIDQIQQLATLIGHLPAGGQRQIAARLFLDAATDIAAQYGGRTVQPNA